MAIHATLTITLSNPPSSRALLLRQPSAADAPPSPPPPADLPPASRLQGTVVLDLQSPGIGSGYVFPAPLTLTLRGTLSRSFLFSPFPTIPPLPSTPFPPPLSLCLSAAQPLTGPIGLAFPLSIPCPHSPSRARLSHLHPMPSLTLSGSIGLMTQIDPEPRPTFVYDWSFPLPDMTSPSSSSSPPPPPPSEPTTPSTTYTGAEPMQYRFPFALDLPPDLPPSMNVRLPNGTRLSVSYTLSAVLTLPTIHTPKQTLQPSAPPSSPPPIPRTSSFPLLRPSSRSRSRPSSFHHTPFHTQNLTFTPAQSQTQKTPKEKRWKARTKELRVDLPLTILHAPSSDQLAYQADVPIHLPAFWPGRLSFAIALPQQSFLLPPHPLPVPVRIRLDPLADDVKVIRIYTLLKEVITLDPSVLGGTAPRTQHVRILSINVHDISYPTQQEGSEQTQSRSIAVQQTQIDLAACRVNLMPKDANGDPRDLEALIHRTPLPEPPPELVRLSNSLFKFPTAATSHSASSSPPHRSRALEDPHQIQWDGVPASDPRLAHGAEDLRKPNPAEIELITYLPIPAHTTPSHDYYPVRVSHRLSWRVLLSNQDGHVSEIRCNLSCKFLHADVESLEPSLSLLANPSNVAYRLADHQLPSYHDHIHDHIATTTTTVHATPCHTQPPSPTVSSSRRSSFSLDHHHTDVTSATATTPTHASIFSAESFRAALSSLTSLSRRSHRALPDSRPGSAPGSPTGFGRPRSLTMSAASSRRASCATSRANSPDQQADHEEESFLRSKSSRRSLRFRSLHGTRASSPILSADEAEQDTGPPVLDTHRDTPDYETALLDNAVPPLSLSKDLPSYT